MSDNDKNVPVPTPPQASTGAPAPESRAQTKSEREPVGGWIVYKDDDGNDKRVPRRDYKG